MGEKRLEITGTTLKFIAVITMLIDHIAAGLLATNVLFVNAMNSSDWSREFIIYKSMRAIGRMAFPIYCYMLVEGYFHTKNIKKYGARLLAVAVISEVPFDLLFRREIFTFKYNNVLWELLLGLVTIWLIDCLKKKDFSNIVKGVPSATVSYLAQIIVFLASAGISELTNLDYGVAGITCILMMYVYYGPDRKNVLKGFSLGVLMLTIASSTLEVFAFLMLIPMYFYKGARGRDSKALRLFFYLFYPAHIIALILIRNCLGF